MKNEKSEKLLQVIYECERVYCERLGTLGFEDSQTQAAFGELMGLEDEFERQFGRNAYILMRDF